MTVNEQREIFSQNFKHMLYEKHMCQLDLAKLMGVPATTVNTWYLGQKVPRVDKLDKMCGIFSCTRSDLLENPDARNQKAYYTDIEGAKLAQTMLDRPELRELLNIAKDVAPEVLEAVKTIMKTSRTAQ